jgi:excisionase family DNA binding protein
VSAPELELPESWQGRLAIRPEELAAAVGVSRSTVLAWLERGELGRIKIGQVVLIPLEEVRRRLGGEGAARPGERNSPSAPVPTEAAPSEASPVSRATRRRLAAFAARRGRE